jgi:hypothetical protein
VETTARISYQRILVVGVEVNLNQRVTVLRWRSQPSYRVGPVGLCIPTICWPPLKDQRNIPARTNPLYNAGRPEDCTIFGAFSLGDSGGYLPWATSFDCS